MEFIHESAKLLGPCDLVPSCILQNDVLLRAVVLYMVYVLYMLLRGLRDSVLFVPHFFTFPCTLSSSYALKLTCA